RAPAGAHERRLAARSRRADGDRGRLARGAHRSRIQPALGQLPARGQRELAVRRAGERLRRPVHLARIEFWPVLAASLLSRTASTDASRGVSPRIRVFRGGAQPDVDLRRHMDIRKRTVVVVVAVVGLAYLALHRGSDDEVTTGDAKSSEAAPSHSLAELVANLPTPAQLRLRPIYIAAGELRLEGQATDHAEQPIAGATITLNGARTATTEADGSFAFDHLAAADYRVSAEKDVLYAEDTISLSDSSEPMSLELKPGVTVVMHVQS